MNNEYFTQEKIVQKYSVELVEVAGRILIIF